MDSRQVIAETYYHVGYRQGWEVARHAVLALLLEDQVRCRSKKDEAAERNDEQSWNGWAASSGTLLMAIAQIVKMQPPDLSLPDAQPVDTDVTVADGRNFRTSRD